MGRRWPASLAPSLEQDFEAPHGLRPKGLEFADRPMISAQSLSLLNPGQHIPKSSKARGSWRKEGMSTRAEFAISDFSGTGCPTLRGLHGQVPNLSGATHPLKEFARGVFRRLLDELLPSFLGLLVALLRRRQAHFLQAAPLALLRGEVGSSDRRPVCQRYRVLLDSIPSLFKVTERSGRGGVPTLPGGIHIPKSKGLLPRALLLTPKTAPEHFRALRDSRRGFDLLPEGLRDPRSRQRQADSVVVGAVSTAVLSSSRVPHVRRNKEPCLLYTSPSPRDRG
eukprot:2247175-Amphidinium_carterae.2